MARLGGKPGYSHVRDQTRDGEPMRFYVVEELLQLLKKFQCCLQMDTNSQQRSFGRVWKKECIFNQPFVTVFLIYFSHFIKF